MSSVSTFDGAILVGLLSVLVTVYLALDKRLRKVERRGRNLRQRIDDLEGKHGHVVDSTAVPLT